MQYLFLLGQSPVFTLPAALVSPPSTPGLADLHLSPAYRRFLPPPARLIRSAGSLAISIASRCSTMHPTRCAKFLSSAIDPRSWAIRILLRHQLLLCRNSMAAIRWEDLLYLSDYITTSIYTGVLQLPADLLSMFPSATLFVPPRLLRINAEPDPPVIPLALAFPSLAFTLLLSLGLVPLLPSTRPHPHVASPLSSSS